MTSELNTYEYGFLMGVLEEYIKRYTNDPNPNYKNAVMVAKRLYEKFIIDAGKLL